MSKVYYLRIKSETGNGLFNLVSHFPSLNFCHNQQKLHVATLSWPLSVNVYGNMTIINLVEAQWPALSELYVLTKWKMCLLDSNIPTLLGMEFIFQDSYVTIEPFTHMRTVIGVVTSVF
jgi:hypothetical protein